MDRIPLKGDLITVYNFHKEDIGREGADLSLVTSGRTPGNGMKVHQGKFILDIGKRFITQRMVSHWKRLYREVDLPPNLSEFKECVDNAFSHMV
ncbi:hypothetical protein WISP_55123 [Willisornis vidua]|uniref:Uncharacterized protein n=1 Tax=Willisornis vidua TaxID=1566151 RepID=A0ABQ9DCC6_9PASS|nr:hypothetical protein WISP_55123 [Willisornis vidua]